MRWLQGEQLCLVAQDAEDILVRCEELLYLEPFVIFAFRLAILDHKPWNVITENEGHNSSIRVDFRRNVESILIQS